ncbi:MAG: AlwI family type II restriction endonuclease [Clostridia bacterium]|nr:AlwI family type II restriction endonuclease [Clostridia bacterium]
MAQKNRSKEIWLIPKRVSLHQTICLIDGVIERNYDRTSWNEQKQNNLGVNLKKWGATKNGKNISSQAIRTLVASIPQYLGFLYINTESTPNTICLTDAGRDLWNTHKDELIKIPNLVQGKDYLITESKSVLRQMEKLQITNPIINKDCENIYVFPFRFMLKVLLKTKYLDQEEIAYFLFKVRNEDEADVVIQEIENFRKLPKEDREALIDAFKRTHIGNITLVKASSAGYFLSLCQITGIISKFKMTPKNKNTSISALKIRNEYISYVEDVLNSKYQGVETYDFKDDLQLWIDYIGNPVRDYPPIDVIITNKTNCSFLVQIFKDGLCKYDDLINANDVMKIPMFVNENYDIKIIDASTGEEKETVCIFPSFEKREFELQEQVKHARVSNESLDDLSKQIIEHCEATNFAGKTLNYLNTLSKITGIDRTNDKSLRGAYFEFFVYKMLKILKDKGIIDDVIWNGKVGKYGLPVQAPGGKTGTPDIVFVIDDLHVVVELTTIKAKALQFSAEASSVPDHIGLYSQGLGKNVVGIFCAPLIHQRNTAAMKATIARYEVDLHCLTCKDFVELLLNNTREELKSKICNKL